MTLDYETFKDALDDEIVFVKHHQRGPVARPANIVKEEDEKEEPEGEEGEGTDPALLSVEAAGDDEDMRYQVWVFAIGKCGRFKKPFKKFTRKPGVKFDKRPTTSLRQAADAPKKPNCINC